MNLRSIIKIWRQQEDGDSTILEGGGMNLR